MDFDEALRTIDTHLCAICWQHLYLPHGAEQPVCSMWPEEHEGYVTKSYVNKRRETDGQDYQEARQVLTQAGVIENPHKGKTPEQLIRELGF